MSRTVIRGRCHCGAHGYSLVTKTAAANILPRACACRFCRMHGANTWADPKGEAALHLGDEAALLRYRFALRTADYLICRICGVYLGAVMTKDRRAWATLNLRLSDVQIEGVPVSYAGESADERVARRLLQWTPVRVCVEDVDVTACRA